MKVGWISSLWPRQNHRPSSGPATEGPVIPGNLPKSIHRDLLPKRECTTMKPLSRSMITITTESLLKKSVLKVQTLTILKPNITKKPRKTTQNIWIVRTSNRKKIVCWPATVRTSRSQTSDTISATLMRPQTTVSLSTQTRMGSSTQSTVMLKW